MTTLYKKDANGQIRVWSISSDDLFGSIDIEHGLLNGAMQTKTEMVYEGKAGRSIEEQIESRMNSRINKRLDQGYVYDLNDARNNKVTNSLGFLKPMKAKLFRRISGINYTYAFVQHKYDGHRCLITCKNGENIAYSNEGKQITQIDHITSAITLQEGQTVDGELYCHGVELQTIGSWIKREQDATKSLSYHMYDMIDDNPFMIRLLGLKEIDHNKRVICVVPTPRVTSKEMTIKAFNQSRNMGYEGLILRWGEEGYRDDYRSKHVLKLKGAMDGEFQIINIIPSKDDWAILVCKVGNKSFKVTSPGTMRQKKEILANREHIIGDWITIEYSMLTKDGIPFHPVAKRLRENL